MIPNSSLIVSSTEPTGKNRKKVWIQKGKNLVNRIITGYDFLNITSADIRVNANWFITDFIPVTGGELYYAQGFSTYNKWWFDKDYQFISCTENNPTIAPDNAVYLRLNGRISNSSNMMVFQGTEKTNYEAYIEPKIYVKNNNGIYE